MRKRDPAAEITRDARIPRATYRLQLNAHFTFKDAIELIPYLSDLGISHVYCSPYFRARPGSTHGYDVVDHNQFNPEIGTREDFEFFVATLRRHGMGHIADFVPNHVGIGCENTGWMDVLKKGADSPYAEFFDIDWMSPDPTLAGKVLVPVLGDMYGNVLDHGELELRQDSQGSSFSICYHEHRFPIARSVEGEARRLLRNGSPRNSDALHELLESQHYRLAYWRVASDEINYRRFFDVNDLAALRMENEAAFRATHALVFELLRAGQIDGLRIDHPDGLYDPEQYFRRLQQQAPTYLLVEKITAGFERLPESWPVHGTTGYRFANVVNGLFVDAGAKGRMERIYRSFIGEPLIWQDVVYDAKRLILEVSFAAELNKLTQQLARITRADRHTRDFTVNTLRQALTEVIACFPVYRSYVTDSASAEDRRFIDWAIAAARRRSARVAEVVFDFLRSALLGETPSVMDGLRSALRRFAMRFQQLTAPVAAKGVEDTALYRFNRLASLNEVGGDPETFGVSVHAFHADARYRARHWPHEMLTTSTHDTKRSEDVRARIDVLTEIPGLWRQMLTRWSRMNRTRKREIEGRPAPGPNQEYLLYQTLLGSWPLESMDAVALAEYRGRIEAYMLKAAREAKIRTSWSDTSPQYEEALSQFIRAILEPREGNLFLNDFVAAQKTIAHLGALNSLSQTLLKLTAPGVPDIYQGNEIWDFSLVDPDNRRPVDYLRRRRLLTELQNPKRSPAQLRALAESPQDGRVKLYLTWKTLDYRRHKAALFHEGEYLAAQVHGEHASHLCAFARRLSDHGFVLVLAPRLYGRLLAGREILPLGEEIWSDTSIELPRKCSSAMLWNVLDDHPVTVHEQAGRRLVPVAEALSNFPVALLASAPLQ